jgi:hypothetical protein
MSRKPDLQKLIRNFGIELMIYGALLVIYFFTILRFLGDILTYLYNNSLAFYAILALILIVAQGVLLETLTSFLIKLLRLDK